MATGRSSSAAAGDWRRSPEAEPHTDARSAPSAPLAGPTDADAVLAELARVLATPQFAHAPRLSRFLRHVVTEGLAGRGDRLKEFAIAAEVFDRGPDYDPASDALVRVEAGRLRQKLQACYAALPEPPAVAIDLPKGGYVPVFTRRPDAPPTATPAQVPAAPPARRPTPALPSAFLVLATLVAGIVVGAVATLGLGDRPAMPRPVNPPASRDAEATAAYLRGRYLRQQMTPAGVAGSVPWFARAVARDPSFAEGWAALGEARATLLFHGLAPGESPARAKADITQALALAPELAEARGVLARLYLVYDWNWPAAEGEFLAALARAPSNARLRQWWAFALASRGRFDEALEQSRRALQLAPDAYVGTTDLAVLLLFARRDDEALAEARQVRALNPSLGVAHVVEGTCLAALRRYDEAVAAFVQGLGDDPRFSGVHGRLGYTYARLGRTEEARAQLDALARLHAPAPVPATDRALVLVGLGDRDGAIAALEEGFARREGEMTFFDVQPFFDPLRADPRFIALRRKAGF